MGQYMNLGDRRVKMVDVLTTALDKGEIKVQPFDDTLKAKHLQLASEIDNVYSLYNNVFI